MQSLKSMLKDEDKTKLKNNFYEEAKNEAFKSLINTLDLKDDILCKYTSLLKDSSVEYQNCINCKGLEMCMNEVKGFAYLPKASDDKLLFSYNECRFMKNKSSNEKYKENIDLFNTTKNLKEAKMKDIFIDDKSRKEILKYIANFIKNYKDENTKGVYLYGNFGSGKTYIISALFNELAKNGKKSAIIYYPEFLRTLKSSFQKDNEEISFNNKYEYIKKVPFLLIDDIGAENVTAWSRDEILGTLLQYRMENNLKTFFTSNLSLIELEEHLSMTSQKIEQVKARRIIERIKTLSYEIKLVGTNRRN